jgi:hypothetical protein
LILAIGIGGSHHFRQAEIPFAAAVMKPGSARSNGSIPLFEKEGPGEICRIALWKEIPLVPPFAKGDVNPPLLIQFKRFVLDKSAFFKGENLPLLRPALRLERFFSLPKNVFF